MKRYIPIVGDGYTKDFFEVNLDDESLAGQPLLEVEPYHDAVIAFQLGDDGLSNWHIPEGSYLLFSSSADTYKDQVLLVRQESKYIIRVGSHIDPVQAFLTVPNGLYPPLNLNSENIRIIGVMSAFILPRDDIRIITNINDIYADHYHKH